MITRNIKYILILFSIIISFNAFSQQVIQIKNKKNNEPLEFVNIQWRYFHGSKDRFGTTNVNGELIIEAKENATIILKASDVGFKPISTILKLKSRNVIFMEEDVFNLEQVTCTGTRTPHILKNAPVLTQMINQEEIENVDGTTIKDIMEIEMPGIEMASHGGVPVMNMLGLEPQYTLLLVDGERLAGKSHGNNDFSRINAANVEKIEIIRGASSALYGSSAMGGVINVITKKPKKKFSIDTHIKFKQQNKKDFSKKDIDAVDEDYLKDFYRNLDRPNLNGDISIGFKGDKFYSHTFLNAKTSDGYKLFDTKGIVRNYKALNKTVEMDKNTMPAVVNGVLDYTIKQELGYKFSEKLSAKALGKYYEHEEFDFVRDDYAHDLYKSYTAGGQLTYSFTSKSQLNLTHTNDAYKRFDFFEDSGNKNLKYNNVYHNTKLAYTNRIGKHSLLMGLENFFESLEGDMFVANEMHKKNTNDAVFLVQDEFSWTSDLMFVAGVRVGYHSAFHMHASPSLTARYKVKPFSLRFSYAKGYRSPSLKELYMQWSHLGMFNIIGSPDLKPETNDYFAFSLDYLNYKNKLNLSLITSFNKVYNKIDGIWANNETEYRYVNFDNFSVFTIEALFKWKPFKNWKIKSGYVFVKNVKVLEAQNLSSMSPHSATGQLEYSFRRKNYQLTANISGRLTGAKEFNILDNEEGSQYKGRYYTVNYPAYTVCNLTVNQRIGRNFSIRAGVKNIFNYTAPIVTFNSSFSPGRRFLIGVGYSF